MSESVPEIVIEPMRAADLDAVMAIELASSPSPWPRSLFLEELAREHARVELLRCNNEIVAFVDYWIVRDELHIHDVATHPRRRREGFATRLLRHVLDVGRAAGCRYFMLEVRKSNDDARRLYERHGFRNVGVRPRYYANNDEDAIVMLLEIATAGSPS